MSDPTPLKCDECDWFGEDYSAFRGRFADNPVKLKQLDVNARNGLLLHKRKKHGLSDEEITE